MNCNYATDRNFGPVLTKFNTSYTLGYTNICHCDHTHSFNYTYFFYILSSFFYQVPSYFSNSLLKMDVSARQIEFSTTVCHFRCFVWIAFKAQLSYGWGNIYTYINVCRNNKTIRKCVSAKSLTFTCTRTFVCSIMMAISVHIHILWNTQR